MDRTIGRDRFLGDSIGGAPGIGADILAGAGAFASSAGATITGPATIASGKASFNGSSRISYVVPMSPSGGIYKVTVKLLARSAGDLTLNFANNDAGTNASTQVFIPRVPGTYERLVTALPGNVVFRLNGVSSYVGEIDDVTVQAVP